jgi:hypothetical protein
MKKHFLKIGVAAMLVLGTTTLTVSCSSSAEDATKALENLEEDLKTKSEKGNWSDEDIEKFHGEIDGVKADLQAMLGDNTDAFVECYLQGAVDNYENFDAANSDQAGMQELATACMQDMMPSMDELMDEVPTEE